MLTKIKKCLYKQKPEATLLMIRGGIAKYVTKIDLDEKDVNIMIGYMVKTLDQIHILRGYHWRKHLI